MRGQGEPAGAGPCLISLPPVHPILRETLVTHKGRAGAGGRARWAVVPSAHATGRAAPPGDIHIKGLG